MMKPPAAPMQSSMDPGAEPELQEHEYNNPETHGHLNTMMEAEHIKADPVKMARVRALAGRHEGAIKAIKSVQDLKTLYNDKFGGGTPKPVKQPPIPQPKVGPDELPKAPKVPKPKVGV